MAMVQVPAAERSLMAEGFVPPFPSTQKVSRNGAGAAGISTPGLRNGNRSSQAYARRLQERSANETGVVDEPIAQQGARWTARVHAAHGVHHPVGQHP